MSKIHVRYISGISHINLSYRSCISKVYLRQISGISQEYLKQILGMSQPYLNHLSTLYQAYLMNISGISLAYLMQILGITANIITISRISQAFTKKIPGRSQEYILHMSYKSHADLRHVLYISDIFWTNIGQIADISRVCIRKIVCKFHTSLWQISIESKSYLSHIWGIVLYWSQTWEERL